MYFSVFIIDFRLQDIMDIQLSSFWAFIFSTQISKNANIQPSKIYYNLRSCLIFDHDWLWSLHINFRYAKNGEFAFITFRWKNTIIFFSIASVYLTYCIIRIGFDIINFADRIFLLLQTIIRNFPSERKKVK